ncbi:hypothetical protein HYE21_00910 [Mycoplasmopsis bovis]|nr:hypothetical protein [Mycoplasmopsis bovis]QQH24291.1 hypothetical protein HYE21_00910 [Mycoplasmopsis bovis]
MALTVLKLWALQHLILNEQVIPKHFNSYVTFFHPINSGIENFVELKF